MWHVAESPYSHFLTYDTPLSTSTFYPGTPFDSTCKPQISFSPEPLNQIAQRVQKLQDRTDA